jgi:hypothetical protein
MVLTAQQLENEVDCEWDGMWKDQVQEAPNQTLYALVVVGGGDPPGSAHCGRKKRRKITLEITALRIGIPLVQPRWHPNHPKDVYTSPNNPALTYRVVQVVYLGAILLDPLHLCVIY